MLNSSDVRVSKVVSKICSTLLDIEPYINSDIVLLEIIFLYIFVFLIQLNFERFKRLFDIFNISCIQYIFKFNIFY